MEAIVLVVHLLVILSLIIVVLLQRSEGGGLGIGGGGGGLVSVRGSANLLTRATAILAVAFFVTSLTLAILASTRMESRSIMDETPAAPAAPAEPSQPGVPLSQ